MEIVFSGFDWTVLADKVSVCLKRANMYVKLMMLGNPDFGNVGDDC